MITASTTALPMAARPAEEHTPFPLTGTDKLFLGYMLLIAIEYLGLGHIVKPIGASRLPTLLAWGLSVMIFMRVGPRILRDYPQNRMLVGFVGFTFLSIAYAYIQGTAFTAFRNHLDYLSLFNITAYLLDRKIRLNRIALVFSCVVLTLITWNIDKLTASTRVSGFMGAFFLGDGNDFAWAMVILLPFALYLTFTKWRFPFRLVGIAATLGCLFAAVGTQSRGATLALGASLFYYWLMISRRKLLALGALAMLVVSVLVLAPAEYFERLGTLSAPTEESSAHHRIIMWGVATRMALENPLGVGAGNFANAYGLEYRQKLRKEGRTDLPDRWLGAHSVYFRALGEYGFLGPIFMISLVILNVVTNIRSAKALERMASPPIPAYWPGLVNMSVIGYATAGAFLGGLTYPHIYVLSALTVSARRFAESGAEVTAPAVVLEPAPVVARRRPLVRANTVRPRPRAAAPAATFRTPTIRPSRGPGRFFS